MLPACVGMVPYRGIESSTVFERGLHELSINENADVIEMAAINMLEDPRAKRIMVIRAGTATVYSK